MPRASDLNNADDALLKASLVEYRSTPTAEKEAFRVACAKGILRARQLDESNEYIVELFAAKVQNWFQNNTEKRTARLPIRIQQSFHPLRIFGHKNRDLIRSTLSKEHTGKVPDSRAYIVQWNETVRQLWDNLPEEEQRPYIHLAELWSIQGPDDDLKPWMAEKRSASWMRAVASMFWTQCGMPVFIYGMFKDTTGKLRATVYDTTEFWADSEPATPQFRNVKGWDQDFRRKAWSFFQAVLEPEQASQETIDLVHAARRQPAAPVVFNCYADSTPILTDQENGKTAPTYRRQHIVREYLRLHYGHAMGWEARSVPWQSIRDTPNNFFEPGILPEGFVLQDPSKITDDGLIKFFNHVSTIEGRADGEINQFRFSHYEIGPKENRSLVPAVYSGTVAAAEPRRRKKTVHVPGFEGPPSDGDSEGTRASQPTPVRSGAAKGRGGSRMRAALVTDFAKVQAELAAKDDRSAKASPAAPDLTHIPGVSAASKGKGTALEPWVEAEFLAAADINEWDDGDDEAFHGTFLPPGSDGQEQPPDLSFASDDEVEGVLDFVPSAAAGEDGGELAGLEICTPGAGPKVQSTTPIAHLPVPTSSPAVLHDLPESRHLLTSPPAPHNIAPNGSDRLAYLRVLAADPAYQDMLRVMELKLLETAVIHGKSPVFWVTWGHKIGHVPEKIQTSEKNIATVMKWVEKGVAAAATAPDVQRYCLAPAGE
ncbi:hypothetical protein LXA43DRAFT_1057650 [Ganoderma leucocontextum]|nr:hypothetical protein LXA43DRAFT_1057650 [Ganoderma leucocontextum]